MLKHQKKEIVALIEEHRTSLGSQLHVANKCGVSEATISQMRNENWAKIKDTMWRRVGAALSWKTSGWQTVETENSMVLYTTYNDAKAGSIWIAVASDAGGGKTTSAQSYQIAHRREGVYFLQAREWRGRAFLRELATCLGLSVKTKDHTDEMIMKIATFFQERADLKPLLIIDEADKLHPQAIRSLIPLYNQLKDVMGVVIQGTDNLERQFTLGKQWKKKGYAELMSRFGGEFVSLPGYSSHDVGLIAAANGIPEDGVRDIWKRVPKELITNSSRRTPRVICGRLVERAVKSQLLRVRASAS